MAVTDIQICNIALGWLSGNRITTLDDGTVEADLCKDNYDVSKQAILEAVDWTFARKRAELTPKTQEIVGADYGQVFDLPADCLVIRQVSEDGSWADWQIVSYELEARQLYADSDKLYIKYTASDIAEANYSSKCMHLIASQLAADICNVLTGSTKIEDTLRRKVDYLINQAAGEDGVQTTPKRAVANRLTRRRFSNG